MSTVYIYVCMLMLFDACSRSVTPTPLYSPCTLTDLTLYSYDMQYVLYHYSISLRKIRRDACLLLLRHVLHRDTVPSMLGAAVSRSLSVRRNSWMKRNQWRPLLVLYTLGSAPYS